MDFCVHEIIMELSRAGPYNDSFRYCLLTLLRPMEFPISLIQIDAAH